MNASTPPLRRPAAAGQASDTWVIEPRRSGLMSRIAELWQYRTLFTFFAARTLERTYRRTVLGWLWVLIRPLVSTAIFVFAFGSVLKADTGGTTPYFMVLLVGLTCWTLFENGVMWSTRSMEINRGIMKSLYFPRLMLPVAGTAPAIVDVAVFLLTVVAAACWFRYSAGTSYVVFGPGLLVAAYSLLATFALAVSIGLFTAVMALKARDIRFLLAYIMRFALFLTPVIYPVTDIPEKWRWIIWMNPASSLISHFQWGVLGVGRFDGFHLAVASGLVLLIFTCGLMFFNRAEGDVIDRI